MERNENLSRFIIIIILNESDQIHVDVDRSDGISPSPSRIHSPGEKLDIKWNINRLSCQLAGRLRRKSRTVLSALQLYLQTYEKVLTRQSIFFSMADALFQSMSQLRLSSDHHRLEWRTEDLFCSASETDNANYWLSLNGMEWNAKKEREGMGMGMDVME